MRDKLNQFVANLNGEFIEVSSVSAKFQCFDLSYNWVFCLDIPKATIQHGSAYEIYSKASDFTREYFEVIPNKLETIPQEGDLVVWSEKYGTYGHVAIVIEATQTKMKVFEQNNPLGTNAHIQDRNYTNVSGFLRPKNVILESVPQWLNTLLQERGLTIGNESQIREIFDRAKRYDEEVKVLREQVISKSEALAVLNNEVAVVTAKFEDLERKLSETTEILNKIRDERDTAVGDNIKAKVRVEMLEDENKKLTEKIQEQTNKIKALEAGMLEGMDKWNLLTLTIKTFFGRG